MSETKWTKGPWEAETGDDAKLSFSDPHLPIAYVRASENGYAICGLYTTFAADIQEANANLIAAAPEMADYIEQRASEGDGDAQELWMLICEGKRQ